MSLITGVELGEAFVEPGVNLAHINTIVGPPNSAAEYAWTTALATPTAGHEPFVAILRPGVPVKPMTLFVSKAAPASPEHGNLIWGPAQAGVAAGVADAVADGTIERNQCDELRIIVAVWVNPDADDAEAVYRNNRTATHDAIVNGHTGRPTVDEVLAARDRVSNPFYTPAGVAE